DADLAEDLGGCLDRALIGAGPLGAGPAGLCHGDLTHHQIVLEGDTPGLVDFDDVCMGEAALDLGHFCAYLRLAARRAAEPAGRCAAGSCRPMPPTHASEGPSGAGSSGVRPSTRRSRWSMSRSRAGAV